MNEYCIENLLSIRDLLMKMDQTQYRKPSALLSGSSIGQHVRHILDLYECLISGIKRGVVSYDKRARQHEVEKHPQAAISLINTTIEGLTKLNTNDRIVLEGNFTARDNLIETIETSISREMAYNLEHSIHHQALIKVGLFDLDATELVDESFGVAPAIIKFAKKQQYAGAS
ncbi:MAG: hypothetical protein ABJN36_18705 [Cyclobacteriaceae bacterium]